MVIAQKKTQTAYVCDDIHFIAHSKQTQSPITDRIELKFRVVILRVVIVQEKKSSPF